MEMKKTVSLLLAGILLSLIHILTKRGSGEMRFLFLCVKQRDISVWVLAL